LGSSNYWPLKGHKPGLNFIFKVSALCSFSNQKDAVCIDNSRMKKKKSPPAKKKVSAKRKSVVTLKKKIALKTKLTKQIEAAVLKAYYELWDANLSADMDAFSSYLVDDFSIFGSANGEVFFSKQDAVKFYKTTADELRGKAELRNRNISVQPLDANSVIVREESDLYVLTGNGWTFYGHARISCVVKHVDGGWKAVHQHASFPDHRTEEGQQLATKKIEKENLELREAVKRRTVELESKNRELEIESSLERVRTVAMAMRKPEDMLQICESLYTELQKLGFSELRNSMINVYNDANTSFLNYDFSGEAGSSTTFFKNNSHPVIENFIIQVRKTRDAFAPFSLSGKKLSDFILFREMNGEKTDIKLRKANAIHYYFYSIGNGSIGISTLKTIPEAQVRTLKRFRNVFEIAYQRYTDITLAEQQAREAQIELALERVRARTMAMQKSEELAAVSEVLRNEMGALGVEELETSSIYIVNENETTECWYAIKDVRGKNKKLVTDHMTLRLDETWVGRQMKKFFYSKETRISIVMKGENRKQWINYCAGKSSVLKGYYGGEIPTRTYHLLKFFNGFMGAASPGEISLESWDLLQRATAVFSFAYKRFSDLQKAEAQTREAMIEAALERIRARALAMHRSEEFTEVAKVMREQMGYLGQPELETSAVHLYEEDADNIFSWRAFRLSSDLKGNISYGFFKIPKTSCVIARRFVQKFKSKATDYTIEVSGAEQAEWYKILFKLAPEVHAAMKKSGTTKEKRYYHFSKFTGGALLMVTSKAPANDAIELQKRSAQVFDLAYRRFKDLQKAEAQARESQIQLALERVRARTMAMQNSNELPAAANLLFQQMQELGMPAWSAGYCIWDKDLPAGKANKQGITLWMSSEGVMQPSFHAPLTEDPSFIHMREAFERNQDFHVEEVGGKELVKHYKYMRTLPVVGKVLDSIMDAGHPLPVFQIFHCVYFSQGFLLFITYEPVPEAHDIFKRFGRVFDQTYTRFLDLQKAEAQAREAQIEAALERVRSRSMAMHKSDELLEAGEILFSEMQKLGIDSLTAGFVLMDKEEKNGLNYTPDPSTKKIMSLPVIIPHNETIHMQRVVENWKKGISHYVVEMDEEETIQHQTFIAERSTNFTLNAQQLIAISPARLFLHNFYFKQGYLLIVGGTRLSAEQIDIMLRFAKVFQQTYTRFLDLQKAEALAREAQIEAALERVRAQTMAMHNSEDVGKCIVKMFSELTALGVDEGTRFGIGILNHDNENIQLWTARKDGEEVNMHIGSLDMKWHPLLKSARKAWKEQMQLHQYVLEGEDLVNYYQMINHAPDYKLQVAIENLPEREFHYGFVFDQGFFYAFSPREFQPNLIHITKRFTSQFEQTYRRYLDLVRAEAQAREGQIEVALERVRAKTMAMQKSIDLQEVVLVLYTQLGNLGFQWGAASITIMNPATGDMDWWLEGFGDGYEFPESYHVPYFNHTGHNEQLEHWKKGSAYAVVEIGGLEKKSYDTYYFNHTDFVKAPENTKQLMMQQEAVLFSMAYMKYGALSWSPTPISDEQSKILQRFASVFEQSYTRFLDLQKAEAQAREAEIELGLERVRARAMAMQKSEELSGLVDTFFKELTKLDFALNWCIINIIDEPSLTNMVWAANPETNKPPESYLMKFEDYPFHHSMLKGYQERKTKHVYVIEGEEKKIYDKYLFNETEWRRVPQAAQDASRAMKRYVATFSFSNFGGLQTVGDEYLSEENLDILSRFGKVFDLTYTRFNDLQKAEAQAREARIEAALERVRSRSMAMHKSEELPEVIQLVFEQLRQLNFNIDSAQFDLNFRESDDINLWTAVPGQPYPTQQHIPYFDNAVFNSVKHAKEAGLSLSVHNFTFEEKNEFFNYFFKHTSIPEERRKFILSLPGWARSVVYLDRIYLGIQNYSGIPYSDTEHAILGRFAKVFEQAYTRFLDLQKAEAQAREAQIEAALERVRAKTMAMHKSEQLPETAQVLFEQFAELGKIPDRISIGMIKEELQVIEWWVTDQMGSQLTTHFHSSILQPTIAQFFTAWKEGKDSIVVDLSGEALKEWIAFVRDEVEMPIDESKMKGRRVHHGAFFSQGLLLISAHEPMPHETLQLLVRFAKVFNQTYTRFLDLQKAEAQAREAQIEAALEKVRSRSLAMHKSIELIEVVNTVFERLGELGIERDTAIINTMKEDTRDTFMWIESKNQKYADSIFLPYINHSITKDVWNAYESGEAVFCKNYSPEDKNEWFKIAFEISDFKYIPEERKTFLLGLKQYGISTSFVKNISIQLISFSGRILEANEIEVLKRFTSVFYQSYTRFLDLQKAEAQAREAQIEAALERVRSRTMAMHNSQEVGESVATLFDELVMLGVLGAQDRCGIGIMQPNEMMELWTAEKSTEKTEMTIGHLSMQHHTLLKNVYQNWLDKKETYQYILEGEDKLKYYEAIRNQANYKIRKDYYSSQERIVHTDFFFNEGCLYVFSQNEFSLESSKIFIRFSAVFGQTYRRYLDLQKAEAQALEAVKRASVDRVRAEIASMRTKQDLERITPLIWKELTTLGIPFVRCGVFIMDEIEETIHTFLSTPDGKAIAAFHVPYGSTPLAGAIEFWRAKKIFLTHWGIKEYAEFADAFIDKNEKEKRTHYLSTVPKEGIYLHLLPFMQGMLYVGNTTSLTEENLRLIQSVADAFSTAYARYEDFNKIESAKAQVEKTLADLKQTQAQLVQSEKMASLGELTAGIAHEIQNPLNFVNNFSEVSGELVTEMNEELAVGNKQLAVGNVPVAISHWQAAVEISNDLKQNLEKINHHGKRAADIVKGMLQHSRSSSGVKEPTDINALADEYLRLAYHGLRAKDKSFNATMKTDFDEGIGKVNVIPQDIGRVILNLITNAFYAVNEKFKAESLPDRQAGSKLKADGENYEPTVSVSTKKEGDKVLISVKDNGNGIPESIKEKIFQPFFTTKPTGQGTGLGLSLSYDIVKAHGGVLKVEQSNENGTTMVVTVLQS